MRLLTIHGRRYQVFAFPPFCAQNQSANVGCGKSKTFHAAHGSIVSADEPIKTYPKTVPLAPLAGRGFGVSGRIRFQLSKT